MTAPPGVDLVELAWATAVRPLARPLQVGPLVVTSREYCCVRATTASGAHGECFVLTRGLDVGGAIERLVAPRVLGAADRPAALAGLRVALRNVGWDGPISRAAGAVALAALDAEARAQGRPVWSLLGADVPPAHDAVVVLGYTPVGADPGETELADAVRAAEAGVRCVKLMGGFGGPERDLARVARLEQAVGDSCRVGLDVNGGWSRADAQEALPRLARDTVAFVEEPWPFELGLEGFDGLPAERPPLAVGEICSSVVELQAMAATGEVALLRADATLLGGAEPWLRAVGSAEAHGVAAFPHFWAEVHRHLMAGCTRRGLVEIGVPGGGEFGLDGLVAGLAVPADGEIVAPPDPGFGFELDWDAIEAAAGPPRVARASAT